MARGSAGGGVAIGDKVRVRYLNGTKSTLQFTLSKVAHAPDQGLVRESSPIGRAVMGAEVGDEIEVLDGSYIRTAIVENVTKN
jgi:transcription elongation GreA/GreB family factor